MFYLDGDIFNILNLLLCSAKNLTQSRNTLKLRLEMKHSFPVLIVRIKLAAFKVIGVMSLHLIASFKFPPTEVIDWFALGTEVFALFQSNVSIL